MNWHDILTLGVILIGGFWTLHKELTAIREAICNKVTYEDCSHKRAKCPLVERIERLERREEHER